MSFGTLGLIGADITFIPGDGWTARTIDNNHIESEGKKWPLSSLTAELQKWRGNPNKFGFCRSVVRRWKSGGTEIHVPHDRRL